MSTEPLDPSAEACWLLQPFQRGEGAAFVEQLRVAVRLVASDLQAVLVLSGGFTRPACPNVSEAASYLAAARDLGLVDAARVPPTTANDGTQPQQHNGDTARTSGVGTETASAASGTKARSASRPQTTPTDVETHAQVSHQSAAELFCDPLDDIAAPLSSTRVLLEESARDSLENLAYGVARFAQQSASGAYPTRITIVGWPFKEARFRAHASALGLAEIPMTYIGAGTPGSVAEAEAGEARAVQAFAADPLGNKSPLLDKRRSRNAGSRARPYDAPLVAAIEW